MLTHVHPLLEDSPIRALDDAALVHRIAQAGPRIDEPAETELCRRFGPRVRLYGLKHLRNAAAAADLVQDVLVIALESLRSGKLREAERLSSFVLGTCRQVVMDQRRTRLRRDRLLSRFAEDAQTTSESTAPPDPAIPLDIARLKHCLERLSERERSVVLMSFYDDRPSEAVGRELGLSAVNVRVIRHRSVARLQECMGMGDASSRLARGETA